MCPDKPPSCYPTPTLGESRFERCDRHAWNQSASGVQIVADREHVFSAPGRQDYEDPMPSQKEPAQAVAAIHYTVEGANRLAEELRAIPPKDPAKRKLDKQGMVSLLAAEIVALQQRGYTIEEVAEGLRGRGLAITTPTLKNYLQRTKSKTAKRAKNGAQTASSRSGSAAPKAPAPTPTQTPPAAKQAASTPEAGAAPEATSLRSGKGAFLVKDKDSY
jgi:hypothetical protein